MEGDTLYAWQEQEENGNWGTILAVLPYTQDFAGGPTVLVTRNLKIAMEGMRELARGHRRASGHKVRLAKFELTNVEVELADRIQQT